MLFIGTDMLACYSYVHLHMPCFFYLQAVRNVDVLQAIKEFKRGIHLLEWDHKRCVGWGRGRGGCLRMYVRAGGFARV